MIEMSLADILRARGSTSELKPRPIAEAQIATLVETFIRYAAPCPFKLGDLVTPRKGFGYSDEGIPHVVLQVNDAPVQLFEVSAIISPASNMFGVRLDCRVACFRANGEVDAFWQESWRLEAYAGEGARP